MTDELKPCPFCGGAAVALSGPVKTLWGVSCLRCACWIDDRAPTAAEAIAAWNRRADLPTQDPTPALGWMAARDAAAGVADRMAASCMANATIYSAPSFRADDDLRQLHEGGHQISEVIAVAIRAMPAPTPARLMAEAVKRPEVAALVDRLAEFAARLADPDTRPNCTCRGCRPRSPQGGQP